MAARGVRWRRPRGRTEQLAAVLVVAAAVWMAARTAVVAVQAALAGWPWVAAAATALAGYGLWRAGRTVRRRRRHTALMARLRLSLVELDEMDDRRFEYALRDLLVRDGWAARQVGRAGDQGADVIADCARYGRLVVQAKHTRVGGRVGSSVMYQLNGTAGPVHRADAAVVVTNGAVTRDAKAWAERHGIAWVDRERLQQWADDGVPLGELLRLPSQRSRSLGRRGVGAVHPP
ncbi:restriction endonuclease [Streptomyces fructofermentans]|uniref:Restriction endonuclease type IV Mrr domain-containing protein n=1 Tax=Streptomyces fructofermentans TaxID=152141 RepID=A0A918U5F8_9ACTN|nr:restriction endonuclease [Streptomyces fructofermentans]GGX94861.1 hypothetical protein GCM10010515_71970 [Streptomyces fructofermentans]